MQWKQTFKKGREYYESGKTKAALASFYKCLAKDESNATLYLYIAAAECTVKHWEKAVSSLPLPLNGYCQLKEKVLQCFEDAEPI